MANKKDIIEMDATVLEVLPNGICKVELENKTVVVAYLKGIFKEKKIKVYPQDKVKVEFSIYDVNKGRIVQKYRTDVRPPDFKKSNSSRKIRNRRH
jgi:translation initiation factor IF-1